MLTEAEAKTKWCPLARVVLDAEHYGAGNRDTVGVAAESSISLSSRCIGAACMAWRWKLKHLKGGKYTRSDHGYCGAFGETRI